MSMMKNEEQKLPSYIVLSPVGNSKGYVIDRFLAAVRAFRPPPDDIILCVSVDSPYDLDRFGDATIEINPEISVADSYLERICSGREILRKHFIHHPKKYQCALWIDTDILCPPEIPRVLYEKMEEEQCLVVVNKVRGRGGDRLLCGSGVMLTHRIACTASRFWIGRIENLKGEEKHLSEDFVFFSIFDQGRHFLKMWTGRSGRVCDEYVKVEHVLG